MDISEFYPHFVSCDFAFTTDSRNIPKNSIFFALKGASFNGNEFALSALDSGAAFAVVDEYVGDDQRLILVEDVLKFFQDLARFHRRCFDIPVIAIAGSNGKTTTKNLIQNVLQSQFRTHCTAGNFNNHIGVPITLLSIPQNCEIAVIELGTNNPGEIAELCAITEPTYGLITNIGKEHLEGFGTLEAVAKEESELYHYLLKNSGSAFVNEDDDWLTRMSRAIEHKIFYSKQQVDIEQLVPSIAFKRNGQHYTSELMGDYNLDNILCAVSIGEHFKIASNTIAKAIAEYHPDNNRSQVIEKGSNLIWLDAYNANPSSMEKAIANFDKMPQQRKVLILGDMFEMGEQADKEHLALLEYIKDYDFEQVYLLGDHFAAVCSQVGMECATDMESLIESIRSTNYYGTAFLIKGSRGMRMERVLDHL